MTTTALQLPIVPPTVTKAREVFSFQVTPAVLREIDASASRFPRGVSGVHLPEAQLRHLGHDMAEAKREQFRAGVHEGLPDAWVRTEVELEISPALGDVTVHVALLVEPPGLLGVWLDWPEKSPQLARHTPPESSTALIGYCTVDGREVYGPRP